MALRVLIAGGGLGGLTLAHALRAAGLQPTVFERGPAHLDLSASYRIHIDANGSRALYQCLPPAQWRDFEARSAAAPRGIAFTSESLRQLAFIPDTPSETQPAARSHPISRSGLRQLLCRGLEDVVTFDARGTGYAERPDGTIDLLLASGESVHGDVLVGADGSTSPIRKQLLPAARVVDTGVGGIAGKVYLDDHTRQLIGERLLHQMTMVLPVRGFGMFLAPFLRQTDEQCSASALDLPEHLFWVVLGQSAAFGLEPGVRRTSGAELRPLALRLAERWHPLLRQLIACADADSLLAVPLHSAQPLPAWRTTRVTLLGDAIHTMTPLQGLGGNTALQDAAVLAHHLVRADRGETDVLSAIGAYEAAMRDYAFDAVQRSLRVSESVASTNVVGRLAFRTVLEAVNAVPALGRLLFKRPATPLDGLDSPERSARKSAELANV
ncbi:MAG: FAD-dependent monooxygenase [Chloroflexi bacterium]|nr:FAD-dependent monooxygenase [Chloroflexota bacterium]